MRNLFIIMLASVLFASCAKISMNDCYNESTAEKDLASLVKNGLLTDEDATLIKDYATEWNYSILDSISYETLLSDAKAEKEKEKARLEKEKEKEREKNQLLQDQHNQLFLNQNQKNQKCLNQVRLFHQYMVS